MAAGLPGGTASIRPSALGGRSRDGPDRRTDPHVARSPGQHLPRLPDDRDRTAGRVAHRGPAVGPSPGFGLATGEARPGRRTSPHARRAARYPHDPPPSEALVDSPERRSVAYG